MHKLNSNLLHHLKVNAFAALEHAAIASACQSTDTDFDRFTFRELLLGQTAFCLLIPAQSAAGPSHPEVNWSLRERAAVPTVTPKIKLSPSVHVAEADGGFQAT